MADQGKGEEKSGQQPKQPAQTPPPPKPENPKQDVECRPQKYNEQDTPKQYIREK